MELYYLLFQPPNTLLRLQCVSPKILKKDVKKDTDDVTLLKGVRARPIMPNSRFQHQKPFLRRNIRQVIIALA